jgi:FG-GAP repeat
LNGVRVSAGDLNSDGRDEIVVTSGFGGDGRVHVLDASLNEVRSFLAYDWAGAGTNVAVAKRFGFPIAAEARTVKLTARKQARVVVARFRDAGRGTVHLRAVVHWGDGTSWGGAVLTRGDGVYDVRGLKRYRRPGRYAIVVTVTDADGRTSVARSTAVVRHR